MIRPEVKTRKNKPSQSTEVENERYRKTETTTKALDSREEKVIYQELSRGTN